MPDGRRARAKAICRVPCPSVAPCLPFLYPDSLLLLYLPSSHAYWAVSLRSEWLPPPPPKTATAAKASFPRYFTISKEFPQILKLTPADVLVPTQVGMLAG